MYERSGTEPKKRESQSHLSIIFFFFSFSLSVCLFILCVRLPVTLSLSPCIFHLRELHQDKLLLMKIFCSLEQSFRDDSSLIKTFEDYLLSQCSLCGLLLADKTARDKHHQVCLPRFITHSLYYAEPLSLHYFMGLYSKDKHLERERKHLTDQLRKIADRVILPDLPDSDPPSDATTCTTVAMIANSFKEVIEEATVFDMFFKRTSSSVDKDGQTKIDRFYLPMRTKDDNDKGKGKGGKGKRTVTRLAEDEINDQISTTQESTGFSPTLTPDTDQGIRCEVGESSKSMIRDDVGESSRSRSNARKKDERSDKGDVVPKGKDQEPVTVRQAPARSKQTKGNKKSKDKDDDDDNDDDNSDIEEGSEIVGENDSAEDDDDSEQLSDDDDDFDLSIEELTSDEAYADQLMRSGKRRKITEKRGKGKKESAEKGKSKKKKLAIEPRNEKERLEKLEYMMERKERMTKRRKKMDEEIDKQLKLLKERVQKKKKKEKKKTEEAEMAEMAKTFIDAEAKVSGSKSNEKSIIIDDDDNDDDKNDDNSSTVSSNVKVSGGKKKPPCRIQFLDSSDDEEWNLSDPRLEDPEPVDQMTLLSIKRLLKQRRKDKKLGL